MQTNPMIMFLVEIINRIGTKTPKVFIVIRYIGVIVAAVTGIPALLSYLNVNLIPTAVNFENHAVTAASTMMVFMSLLPTKPTPIAIDSNGVVLSSMDDSKLPFTAANVAKNSVNLPQLADICKNQNPN